MNDLHAWLGDALIGRFWKEAGEVRFEYRPSAPYPVSLSLPISGGWDANAPGMFLEALLPDEEADRQAMKESLKAASTDPFDLLVAVDSAGGLCFTSSRSPKETGSLHLSRALDGDIALKVRRLSQRRGSWQADDGRSRFSLAGTQGKFSLAGIRGHWFWPNAKYPSTHIVKPSGGEFAFVGIVEHSVMTFAQTCGIPAAKSSLTAFSGEEAYTVERFDRRFLPDGSVERIHVEDLTQSLGLSRDDKYKVAVKDVAALLLATDETGDLCSRWFGQLLYNTMVGNCDAHAKNYSLSFGPQGVGLCPLYDCVCTLLWDGVSDTLAMPVNGREKAAELTLSDWVAQAAICGLNQQATVEAAARMALTIAANLARLAAQAPEQLARRLRSLVANNNAATFKELGIRIKGGEAFMPAGKLTVPFAEFPESMNDSTLLETIHRKEFTPGGAVRLNFEDGAVLRTGQRLPPSYAVAPAGAERSDGLLEMPRGTRLQLVDARIDLPCDEVVWGDLCDASRDAISRRGLLEVQPGKHTGDFSVSVSRQEPSLERHRPRIHRLNAIPPTPSHGCLRR